MERIKSIRINPIMKKDLRVLSRTMKIAMGLFFYEAVLMIVFLFAIWLIFEENNGNYGYSANYQAFVTLFPLISAIEFGIIALLMPIMTATAISGEKERQTFDILLTTVMSPRAIIRGKVGSAVVRVMVFMVASIPLMALSFTLGGLSWFDLFITMIAFLIFAILTGSLGILASTLTSKSITGIILTYVFYFVFANITFVPTLIIGIVTGFNFAGDSSAILMLFNPVSAITEMFLLMLGSDSGISGRNGLFGGWIWVFLSGVVMLFFSVLFQELAARRIDPLHGYIKEQKKKRSPVVSLDMPKNNAQVPENWAPGQADTVPAAAGVAAGAAAGIATAPVQNVTPEQNVAPVQNAAPEQNVAPVQNAAPEQQETKEQVTTPEPAAVTTSDNTGE